MLKYKGYLGSSEFDFENDTVFGKLMFIRDLVTYESQSPSGLKEAFESAVDDYLADCEELDRQPEKPCKGQFNVRVSPELHRELAVSASKCDKSLNDYVSSILQDHKRKVTSVEELATNASHWMQFMQYRDGNLTSARHLSAREDIAEDRILGATELQNLGSFRTATAGGDQKSYAYSSKAKMGRSLQ